MFILLSEERINKEQLKGWNGAGGRTRTDTLSPAADFESVFEIIHGRACSGLSCKNSKLGNSTTYIAGTGRAQSATKLRPLPLQGGSHESQRHAIDQGIMSAASG